MEKRMSHESTMGHVFEEPDPFGVVKIVKSVFRTHLDFLGLRVPSEMSPSLIDEDFFLKIRS